MYCESLKYSYCHEFQTITVAVITVKHRLGKDIAVTGHGGPYGCERLRFPHYLDKRLIDGGKVVSPTRRVHLTPRFLYF
jgi:hypothetical protein